MLLMKEEDDRARLRSTHGGQPKPQQVTMAAGIFKVFDKGPDGVEDVSRRRRPKRAIVPAPNECPARTKPKSCQRNPQYN